jgi:PleD family two-component response regulator
VTELRPYDDAHSVLVRADDHLYAAKRAGRNRVSAG